jgi:hypothetical protein
VPQLVQPRHHEIPVSHRDAAALIVKCECDVTELGELIGPGPLMIIEPLNGRASTRRAQ